jgi:hypothetical protein
MVTAHVVVLQLLLAGFIVSHNVTALDTANPFVICAAIGASHDDAGGAPAQQQRQHHQPCTLCPTGLVAAAVLPEAGLHAAPAQVRTVSFLPATYDVAVARQPTPRLSQGPPSHV